MRQKDRWRFAVIATAVLSNYVTGKKMGTKHGEFRNFNIIYDPAKNTFECSGETIGHHLEDWAVWPLI